MSEPKPHNNRVTLLNMSRCGGLLRVGALKRSPAACRPAAVHPALHAHTLGGQWSRSQLGMAQIKPGRMCL